MKKGHAKHSQGIVKPIVIGLCVSCLAAAVVMGMITILIQRETLLIQSLGICIPIVHFIAIFTGCLTAALVGKEKILISCGIVIGVMYLVCFSTTILAFDGEFSGIIPGVVLGLLGAVCAIFIQSKCSKGRHRQFRKRKIC